MPNRDIAEIKAERDEISGLVKAVGFDVNNCELLEDYDRLIATHDIPLDRLQAMCEAHKLLLKTVYIMHERSVVEGRIACFEVGHLAVFLVVNSMGKLPYTKIHIGAINETVFLTEAEAKAKLEGLK